MVLTRAMKVYFLIAECYLFYAKIMETPQKTKETFRFLRFDSCHLWCGMSIWFITFSMPWIILFWGINIKTLSL
ncbi:hypothetical protein HMPREF0671_09390 [Prevotella sp. S7 MS 2]|nr:hypothetical protein HMPREF0671_09390 [Prevotella sp. S7 MS 2]